MAIINVGKPQRNKQRGRWLVRWTDEDGRARSKTLKTEQEAYDFRASLLGETGKPAKTRRRRAAASRPGKYDGSAKWWRSVSAYIAGQILAGAESGDDAAVDRWGKAARGVNAASQSELGHRDLDELEAQIVALEAQEQEETAAIHAGARVESTSSVEAAGEVEGDATIH